jgi:predicted RNase H-like nuclease (RuvC/YqgF family)
MINGQWIRVETMSVQERDQWDRELQAEIDSEFRQIQQYRDRLNAINEEDNWDLTVFGNYTREVNRLNRQITAHGDRARQLIDALDRVRRERTD